LELLVAYLSLDEEIAPQKKLAALHSVQAHPALTPQIRRRAAQLCEALSSTPAEEYPQPEKSAEVWAEEILGQAGRDTAVFV